MSNVLGYIAASIIGGLLIDRYFPITWVNPSITPEKSDE